MSPQLTIVISLLGASGFLLLEWILSRGSSPERPARDAPATAEPEPAAPTSDLGRLCEGVLRHAAKSHALSAVGLWVEREGIGRTESDPLSFEPIAFELFDPQRGAATDLAGRFAPWRHALLAGETVCLPDAGSEPDLCGVLRLAASNLLLVPIRLSATQTAVLALAWNRPASLGAEEQACARAVAGQLRAVLGGRTEKKPTETAARSEEILLRVAGALRHLADLPIALRSILEATCDGLGYRNAAILLVDVSRGQLYVASQVGYGECVDALRLALDGPSVTATAARERRIVAVPDVTQWPGYVPGHAEIRSEIALPLLVDGELQGVLDIESVRPDAFSGASRPLLDAIAAEAAFVLAHAQTLRRLQEQAECLQAADQLARGITASIDPQTILDRAATEVRASIGAAAAVVLQHDGSKEQPWSIRAVASERSAFAPPPLPDDFAAFGEVLRSDAEGVLDDTRLEPSPFARWCHAAGWLSAYWMPVVLNDKLVGLFVVGLNHANGLTDGRRGILRALAPHMTAAVRNAQLYEQIEFSYQQLSKASAMLAHNDQLRALGEITSSLAHKFNNLLGVILGRVQTALARSEGTEIERDLRIVEQAAFDGSSTIRQLQQFTGTRAERATRPVAWSELAERAVERALRKWRSTAEAESVETYRVHTEIAEDAWVEGTPEECGEILEHLLHNAVEAMPEGGTLGVRVAAGPEGWILEVSDTGPGIDERTRARLFHPFVTTKGPRNLGLGLSIAYAIVNRLGGEIRAEDAPSGGALLRVELPAAEASTAPSPSPAQAPRAARILIVDDEPAVADVLSEMLQTARHECTVETSPGKAVERLASETFDLVLSDVGMPGMSGWDLAVHCRDLHAEIPVILVTGWGLEVEEERVVEAGVFEVVAKPFEMQAVLDAVARALRRQQAQAA